MDTFYNNDRLYSLPKYRFFLLNYLYLKLSENLKVHRKFDISKHFVQNNSLISLNTLISLGSVSQ